MHIGHKPAERSAPEALGPEGRKSGAESGRHIADPMIPKLYLASTEESSCWRRALSKLIEEVHAMATKSGNGGSARSAVTGQYVKQQYAKTHPNTTVIERKPAPKPQPPKRGK